MVECSGNLGPRQRCIRALEGAAAATTALGLAAWCTAPCGWVRAVIVTLATAACFCALQAAANTCAILAMRGRQDLDRGSEPIVDAHLRTAVLARGQRIVIATAIVFVLASVTAWLLPEVALAAAP